jgi:hypothetical protein
MSLPVRYRDPAPGDVRENGNEMTRKPKRGKKNNGART